MNTVSMLIAVTVEIYLKRYISLFNSEKICSKFEHHERLTQVKLTSLYAPISNLGMER